MSKYLWINKLQTSNFYYFKNNISQDQVVSKCILICFILQFTSDEDSGVKDFNVYP